jgi:hypothetical protein
VQAKTYYLYAMPQQETERVDTSTGVQTFHSPNRAQGNGEPDRLSVDTYKCEIGWDEMELSGLGFSDSNTQLAGQRCGVRTYESSVPAAARLNTALISILW